MCGLAGILVGNGGDVPRVQLLRLARALEHRGPDGCGLLLDNGFGMISTRLSIVDLARGDQPLSSEDGRFHVMQNGEIYNHVELRRELRGLGHTFVSECDTEVIVHAYEQWGPGCLRRFNGDFAIAVWDAAARELFLARDRFGVRPLFIASYDGKLVFCSELRAMLGDPSAPRSFDPLSLTTSFALWSVPPSRSIVAGIRQLMPGHWMLCRPDGSIEEKRWWHLPFEEEQPYAPAAVAEQTHELSALLEESVRLRLRASVEVGVYVSGGLDSSAIVALAARHASHLRGFGVAFSDPAFDERTSQDAVADHLAIELHRLEVDDAVIGAAYVDAVVSAQQPTLRTALVPLYLLSKLVRETGLKVVLTGEGADELFAGYDLFKEDRIRRFWARDQGSRLRPLLLDRLYPYMPTPLSSGGELTRGFFARGLTETDDPLYSHRIRLANGSRFLSFFVPDAVAPLADAEAAAAAALQPYRHPLTPLASAQLLETATFLCGYLLHAQGDRMLMAHGIEGRFPYLDYRVAEFAARLPSSARMLGLREKRLLRRVAAPIIPRALRERVKQPYRAPVARVLAGPSARPEFGDLLTADSLRGAGIFEIERVQRLVAKLARAGARPVAESEEMALCGILSTMIIHDRVLGRTATLRPLEPTREVILTAGAA